MATKRTAKRRAKPSKQREPIRVRRRGGNATGTAKEDKRTTSMKSPEKNLRKDHDKATVELEATAKGKRPSRKSTRRGANRMKPDSQLKRRATRAVRSPESRHEMRGG